MKRLLCIFPIEAAQYCCWTISACGLVLHIEVRSEMLDSRDISLKEPSVSLYDPACLPHMICVFMVRAENYACSAQRYSLLACKLPWTRWGFIFVVLIHGAVLCYKWMYSPLSSAQHRKSLIWIFLCNRPVHNMISAHELKYRSSTFCIALYVVPLWRISTYWCFVPSLWEVIFFNHILNPPFHNWNYFVSNKFKKIKEIKHEIHD